MAVTVTLTGNGSIGQVEGGWTVVEDATPVAPGDSSGSTGSVSFNARMGTDSEFIIDNGLSFAHDTLGTISGGKVDDLQTTGMDLTTTDAQVTGGTILSRLATDRIASPTVEFGYYGNFPINIPSGAQPIGMVSTLNEIHVLYSTATTGQPSVYTYDQRGNFLFSWAPRGTGTGQITNQLAIGVDPGGFNFYIADNHAGTANGISVWTRAASGVAPTYSTFFGTTGTGNGQFNGIQTVTADSSGNIYTLDPVLYRVQKFTSAGTYTSQWGSNGTGNSQFLSPIFMAVQPGTNNIIVSDNGAQNVKSFTNTGTFNSIIASGFNATRIGFYNNPNSPIYYANSSGVGRLNLDGTYTFVATPIPQAVGIAATDFGIFAASGTVSTSTQTVTRWFGYAMPYMEDIFRYYFGLVFGSTLPGTIDFQYNSITFATTQAYIPGWSGDVWDHIKQICSAYGWEIYLQGSGIRLRDLGTLTQAIDNVQAGSVSLTLNSQATGLSVDFKNYNTTGGYGTVYDSSVTGETQSVNVGDIQYFVIQTNNYATSFAQPVPVSTVPGIGQYSISAQNTTTNQTTLISAADWVALGGLVQVVPGSDLGSINITIFGPLREVPGFQGPYSIGYPISGSTVNPGLNIQGTAVFTNPTIVTILTGADPTKTSTVTASTVDNFCFGSASLIYQRATWTTWKASGPNLQLTVTIPTSRIGGFGLSAGSLISFRESTYRVSTSRIGNEWTQITADRYVTVGQTDATINPGNTLTVGQFDTFWNNYTLEDADIKPLRKVV